MKKVKVVEKSTLTLKGIKCFLERINASCYILAPNSISNSRVGIPFFGYNPEQNEWTIMAASIPKIKGDNRYSFAIPINS